MDLQPPSSTSSPSKRGKDAHTIAAYFFLQVFGIHPLRKISEIIISQKEFITCCPGGGGFLTKSSRSFMNCFVKFGLHFFAVLRILRSAMGKKAGSGSGMNNPDHISESLETIFWVKILKFFDGEPGSVMENMWIRDKHPGSATLVQAWPGT
jgi:hypothetical protein